MGCKGLIVVNDYNVLGCEARFFGGSDRPFEKFPLSSFAASRCTFGLLIGHKRRQTSLIGHIRRQRRVSDQCFFFSEAYIFLFGSMLFFIGSLLLPFHRFQRCSTILGSGTPVRSRRGPCRWQTKPPPRRRWRHSSKRNRPAGRGEGKGRWGKG